ncbi:MAG: hypothetical protein SFU98_22665 [Leptospiraceae bacterium]|nr:hypothetical protein [Leptospiraceae bacterium]
MKKIIILILLVFCKPKSTIPSFSSLLKTHPAARMENYPKQKLEERIFNLPKLQNEFIHELNIIDGIENIPAPSTDFLLMKEKMDLIFKNSNPKILKILDKYVLGIYFSENLGTTGLTSFVYDKNLKPVGGIIFIDSNLVKLSGNEWISYKENTVFIQGKYKLKIEIDNGNSKFSALEYILLHELGHIVSVVDGIVPDFTLEKRNFKSFPFFHGVWSEEKVMTELSTKYPELKKIKFYSKPELKLDVDALEIYSILEVSPFPTVYSTINADDHFAESFVSYLHTLVGKKPWRLTIINERGEANSFENGISKERCKLEREFMEKWFRNAIQD